jgi:hypothetical protein
MIYINCVYSQWINSYVSYSCQNTVAILGVSEYGSMRFSLFLMDLKPLNITEAIDLSKLQLSYQTCIFAKYVS